MQQKGSVPDVKKKPLLWQEFFKSTDTKHMVFLDESGVNTNMTRLYGRSIGKARVVEHTPLNTPVTTTVLSSVRTDGTRVALTYQGGTTGARFVTYLKEILLPTLKPQDVVIMDNLPSHHVKAGIKYCYLPQS